MSMLSSLGESKQVEIVRAYPSKIFQIPNPVEQAKLIAVQHDGLWLGRLRPTSRRVELAAVKQNGMALQFVNNPTKEMKSEAVKNSGMALQFIKGPSFKLKRAAVSQNGLAIQFVKAPNSELWNLAVEQNGRAIQFHPDPPEGLKKEAVTSLDPDVITFIDNPSESLMIHAVTCNGLSIRHLPPEMLTPPIQRLAVKANANSIDYIPNPSEDVQVMAVKANARLIYRIQQPHRAACAIAKDKGLQI